MDIFDLINKSKSAISHSDSSEAYWLLRDWKNLLASTDASRLPYPPKDINLLLLRLQVTAFPHLSDNESAELLRNHLLEFFNIETSLEPLLIEKLFLVPYGVRRDLRELLKRSILANNEILGRLTISQWIGEFDKKHDPKTRTQNASLNFVNNHLETQKMDVVSKDRLKKILHAYDYLLVYTLSETEPELSQMMEKGFSAEKIENQGQTGPIYSYQSSAKSEQNVNMPFNEAMKKYPEMGEQIITSYKINLKMFPEPARPSIKNWISDYTFNVGYNNQDSLARSNYLFQNQNTKNLSSVDRSRLSFILKSFDENSTVSVNSKTMQIVIPESAASQRPAPVRPEAPPPLINRSAMEFRSNGASSSRPVYEMRRSASPAQPVYGQAPERQMPERRNFTPQPANEAAKKTINENGYQNDHRMSISHTPSQHDYHLPTKIETPKRDITAPIIPKSDLISFNQRPSATPKEMTPIVTAPAPARTQMQTPPPAPTRNVYPHTKEPEVRSIDKRGENFGMGVNFSSPQRMPYEKVEKTPQTQLQQINQSQQPKPQQAPPQTHPYRISYGPESASEEKTPQQKQQTLPKNVVNLRE